MALNYPQVQEYKIQWKSHYFSAQSQPLCRISSYWSFTFDFLSIYPLVHQEETHRDSKRVVTYHYYKLLLLQWTHADPILSSRLTNTQAPICQSSSFFRPSKSYTLASNLHPITQQTTSFLFDALGLLWDTYTLPTNNPKVPNPITVEYAPRRGF